MQTANITVIAMLATSRILEFICQQETLGKLESKRMILSHLHDGFFNAGAGAVDVQAAHGSPAPSTISADMKGKASLAVILSNAHRVHHHNACLVSWCAI